jgi:hypothetical protein
MMLICTLSSAFAMCAIRYRRWALNAEAGIDIVVRCEIDGVINNKGEDQLLSIKVGAQQTKYLQQL